MVDLTSGRFREYDKAFHALGLLYCASMNTATNDHIADFVKGAHLLAAAAVIVLFIAAIPTGIAFSSQPSPTVQATMIGPVKFSAAELSAVAGDVAQLRGDVATLASSRAVENWLKQLDARVGKLETSLSDHQKRATPAGPRKK